MAVTEETEEQKQLHVDVVGAIRSGDYSKLPEPLPDMLEELKQSFQGTHSSKVSYPTT